MILYIVARGYCGGSPTAVQAWQPRPLWEPSPSHPVLLWTRGLAVFISASFICLLFLYVYAFCVLFVFSGLFSFVAFFFSTLILLVGSFDL